MLCFLLLVINECGKTTVLNAILAFTNYNDNITETHLKNINNIYTGIKEARISAIITCSKEKIKKIFEKFKDDMNEVSYDRLTRSLDNKIELKISRKINGDKIYTIEIFEKNDEEYLIYNMQHKIADYIINKELPPFFTLMILGILFPELLN